MSRLRDLRVASKLFAGSTVVVVLLVTVGVVGFVGLRTAQHRLEDVYGNSVVPVSSLQRVQTDFVQSLQSLDDLVIADNETHTATAIDDLKTADAALAADGKAYLGSHPAQTAAQTGRFDTTLSSYLSAGRAWRTSPAPSTPVPSRSATTRRSSRWRGRWRASRTTWSPASWSQPRPPGRPGPTPTSEPPS